MWEDDCDKLDGCYFIKRNMPPYPQHANCRCRLVKISKPIPWETAFAQGDRRNFSEYIFNPANSKGKTAVFLAMGYTIQDSQFLQNLYIEQGLRKYCDGNYRFVGVSNYVVKIEILIELPTISGTNKVIKSGLSLLPNDCFAQNKKSGAEQCCSAFSISVFRILRTACRARSAGRPAAHTFQSEVCSPPPPRGGRSPPSAPPPPPRMRKFFLPSA